MPKLYEFITAENELDGQEYAYISQIDKTRKTTYKKIKDWIIGAATLKTTDKTVIGAINENTASLSDIANKITSQRIVAGTDLNTVLTPGVRRHTFSDTDARTLLNIPRSNITSFSIDVYVTTSTTTYIVQKITERDGTTWIRCLNNGVWGNWRLTTSPGVTTSNLTYYVDPVNGKNTNNGLASTTAFSSISKAISMIPQVVNHAVVINLAPGGYAESLIISGFTGSGNIKIVAGTSLATAVNYIIASVQVLNCTCLVVVTGVTTNTGTTHSFFANNCLVQFSYCDATIGATTAYSGFLIQNSLAYINNCNASNKKNGIYGSNMSTIYSSGNTGVGNVVGITATAASTIGKYGTQCGGTTAQIAATGGMIR